MSKPDKKPKPPDTEEIKQKLRTKKATAGPDFTNALSTGSTLLNLAYTGRPNVGYVPGTYNYHVGDSDSGKSFLSMVAMAEATLNPHYKDYQFILDNVEDGIQMPVVKFFGREVARRIKAPQEIDGEPRHSETVEEFYFNLDDALDRGPCIYILDSMDGVSSESEEKHFLKLKKAARKASEGSDDEVTGSYGDGKAKINSAMIRQMLPRIKETGSILIIISQTRDNIKKFSFEPKARSGGHALAFYAQVQCWSSIRQKLNKPVRGIDRHIGNRCQFHIKRSRYTGKSVKVEVPIYFSSGVDDVGSCVDYLITEKHWEKTKSTITAPEFSFKGTREKLIELIESSDREKELQGIVARVWIDIEEAMGVNRKRRYK